MLPHQILLNGNIIVDDTDSVDHWHDAEEVDWASEEEFLDDWQHPTELESWTEYKEEAHWSNIVEKEKPSKWHDFPQWDQPSIASPKSYTRKSTRAIPQPIGFPCALFLLSWIMWSMQSVGMFLKLIGLHWADYRKEHFRILNEPLDYLKEIVWQPPKPGEDKTHTDSAGKKRLLMLGLLIAMKKAGSVPAINLLQDKCKFNFLNKKRGRTGLLLTGKLAESDFLIVREAISLHYLDLLSIKDKLNLLL
jgi:hypothetical protein